MVQQIEREAASYRGTFELQVIVPNHIQVTSSRYPKSGGKL